MARILAAEDSAEIRTLVSSILVEQGHEVGVAQNGQQALDMMMDDPPDVLVLDIMMPQMDGYTVLKELKSSGINETVKILILTRRHPSRTGCAATSSAPTSISRSPSMPTS